MELMKNKSKLVWGILIGILCLVILLGVFQLGTMIGFQKARFACQWGEKYGAMIGMPLHGQGFDAGPGPMMGWPQRGVPDANGGNGIVISVNGQSLIFKGPDGIEKTVVTTSNTKIREGNSDAVLTDILPEDRVVIIGSPNDRGEISASFIRVFNHKLIP